MRKALRPALVATAYVVSRILAWRAGVRFDDAGLAYLWQLLDPVQLREHPWQSVWYMHISPPAFNLYVGLILGWFPGSTTLAFHATYLAAGLTMSLCLYALMVRLTVIPWVATLATIVFVISPSAICYENWLMYDYPIAVCLVATALAIHVFVRRGGWLAGFVMASLLAGLPLLRNAYHLVWLLAAIALLLLFARARRRRTLAVIALPLLVVLVFHAKNWALFGFFGTSSWAGQNLVHVTTLELPKEERMRLVAEGVLSPIAGYKKAFLPITEYAPHLPPPEVTGIPVLDDVYKSTGSVNLNHKSYLQVAKLCMDDFKATMRVHPEVYFRTQETTWMLFLESATSTRFIQKARVPIEGWNHLYNRYLYGELTSMTTPQKTAGVWTHVGHATNWRLKPYFLVAGIPLAFLYGLIRWLRAWRRRGEDPAFVTTLGFLVMAVAYAALVHNLVAVGDNHRYRFGTDAFFLTLLAMLGSDVLRALYARWGAKVLPS